MDEYYSVHDAADKLHVNRKTVYRWIYEGKILKKHIKVFPSGIMAINSKALVKPPARKKYTKRVVAVE